MSQELNKDQWILVVNKAFTKRVDVDKAEYLEQPLCKLGYSLSHLRNIDFLVHVLFYVSYIQLHVSYVSLTSSTPTQSCAY